MIRPPPISPLFPNTPLSRSKRLSDARRDGDRIQAIIRGFGLNNDGSDKVSFAAPSVGGQMGAIRDRKSTRLNSSHSQISYAVFCLKKKNIHKHHPPLHHTSR